MLKIAYRWHQQVGIWVGLAIIFWGLSGLVHPILSAINPKPLRFSPPASALPLSNLSDIEWSTCLKQASTRPFHLINIEEKGVVVSQENGEFEYCDPQSGMASKALEKTYLTSLVSHYLQLKSPKIKSMVPVKTFDEDYLFINRILPVVAVALDREDNMTVYLDPTTGKLAALVNDTKRSTSAFFRFAHNWLFISNDVLRQIIMSLFLLSGWAMGVMGLVVYFKKPKPQREGGLVRLHRQISLPFAVLVLTFSFSGTFHLWQKWFRDQPVHYEGQYPSVASTQLTSALNAFPNSNLDLLSFNNLWHSEQFLFRATTKAKDAKMDKRTPLEVWYWSDKQQTWLSSQDSLFAKAVLSQLTTIPATEFGEGRRITSFGGEYGFIQKRLPVWQFIHQESGKSYYVDSHAQLINASFGLGDRLEGWTFAYLHKWSFLDFLGGKITDIIVSLAALFLLAATIFGSIIYKRKHLAKAK